MIKIIATEVFKALAISAVIVSVVFLVLLVGGTNLTWNYSLKLNLFYSTLYTSVLYLANSLVFRGMDAFFGKGRMTVKRLFTGFAASLIITVITIFLLRVFNNIILEKQSFEAFTAAENIKVYYLPLVITFMVNLLIHAFYFYRRFQENRVKEQKIIAGTASAKFESLKNQIDPHFLFNSLNVLSSLIEENPDNAQRFTTSLSKVYRYVLEQKDKELVSIEEELAFAKTYMNLLKMRFENSVFYELPQTISDADAKVVPLSLQLLLENTIKHNVVSQERPLHIKIFEANGYLVVQNDYQKKEVLHDRQGVGLQNIINRYAIITSRKVKIEQTEKHFTVQLPVLTKQITIMETVYNETETSYYKAQKKVKEIKDFYSHLITYCIIIMGLMILNIATYPEYLWFFFPALGWGVGLALHAAWVFNAMPFLGTDWEERKIKELMEKDATDKWQ